MKFKKTMIDRARLGVAWRNFAFSLKQDFVNDFLRPLVPESWRDTVRNHASAAGTAPSSGGEKPIIFVSYATDESLNGSHRYCGGEKLLNNLVLMLRRRGYEAYMVSLDGKHADWLAEHAPFLSVENFKARKTAASDVRYVSSWVKARPFLKECPRFYFWDQELSASSRSHFPDLASLMAAGRIIRTAGVNRAVQAFHRCVFETEALTLRQLIDEAHWKPDPARRIRHRVGYFDEGDHGAEYVRRIGELTKAAGLSLEFIQLSGVEREIIVQMQQCGVFMALNIGKSHLWGEGGPMSPQEAMACGTVPVCYDINGPWELIQQDYNGAIARETTPEAMAESLIWIYSAPGRLEEMSRRTLEIFLSSHSMEARWPEVTRFLDLPQY
jgi:glycosyltransferase involved in cell wall biosynthesis